MQLFCEMANTTKFLFCGPFNKKAEIIVLQIHLIASIISKKMYDERRPQKKLLRSWFVIPMYKHRKAKALNI